MKRSLLLLLTLLATSTVAHAATEADTAKKKAGELPGLKLMSGLSVSSASPGYTIGGISNTDVTATVFNTDAGWHGSLELGTPSTFAFDELANLGSATLSSVLFVVSAQADQIPNDKLPTSIRADLAAFQVGGKLSVDAGVNLFVTGKAGTTGLLGQLKQALGLGSEGIRIRALIGEGAFKRALGSATSSAASADPTKLSISVTLPKLFAPGLADKGTGLFFEATTTTLTWTRNGTTNTISGKLDGSLTLGGGQAAITGTLAATGTGAAQTLVLDAKADLAITSLWGLEGVDLTKVSASIATAAGGSSALALAFQVKIGGTAYTGRFAAITKGSLLQEVSFAVDGTFKLPAIQAAFGEDLAITNPSIGFRAASNSAGPRGGSAVRSAAFMAGKVTWRGLTSTTVLVARSATEIAAFVQLGKVNIATVLQWSKGSLAVLDNAIAIVSSADLGALPASALPSPATAMLDTLGAVNVTPTKGLALMGKLSLGTNGATLGVSGEYVVAGAIGTDGTFALYADLATFTLPSSLKGVALPSTIKPKVYIALRAGQIFELGVELEVTFELEQGRSLAADGQLSIKYGQQGGAIAVAGALRSDWVDPFGLAGITIHTGTALSFTAATDGSAKVMAKGAATFGTNTLELGGGVNVLFSTGAPVVKGFAFRFAATELGLTTPMELGQVLIRAAAAAIDKKTLPKAVADGLVAAAKLDLVAAFKAALPESTLTTFAASLKLKSPLLFVATPGMGGGDPDFKEFDDAGVQVKGTLVLGTKELGSVDVFATILKGFQLDAKVKDFSLGELDVTGAQMDIGAGIPGLGGDAAHFQIKGNATLGGKKLGAVEVEISADTVLVKGSLSVFGVSVSMAGEMTSKTVYSLAGKATLTIPGAGEVAGVSVKLGTSGVSLTASAKASGVRFTLQGSYSSKGNWSISGKVSANLVHTIDLPTGDIDVHLQSSVTWKLSDDGASLRCKGKAWGYIANAYTEVTLDEEVSTSGKITFDFGVYKPTVDVLP